MIMLCIAYGAKIILFIAGLPFNVPSIRNYLFFLQHILNRAMVLLDIADLLLAIPSNWNQPCPLHDAFNWSRLMFLSLVPSDYFIRQESSLSPSPHPVITARITLGVVGLPLTIPSTRNYLSLLILILSTWPE